MFTYRLTSLIWSIHWKYRTLQWTYRRYKCRMETFAMYQMSRKQWFIVGVVIGFLLSMGV